MTNEERANKMIDDCMNSGLGFTESVSLSVKFVSDQIESLEALTYSVVIGIEWMNLKEIKNYLLGKL